MKTKRWWQSRTHWLNAGTFFTVTSTAALYVNDIGLSDTATAWAAIGLSLINAGGNAYLRNQTDSVIVGKEV